MNIKSVFGLPVVVLMMSGCTINTVPRNSAPVAPAAPAAPAPAAPPAAAATPGVAAAAMPTYAETAPPKEQPQLIKFNVADGRPKGLHSGAFEAVWVWHDTNGKKWHVRSTTHSVMHRFHGGIIPDSGQVTSVKPTRVRAPARLARRPREPRAPERRRRTRATCRRRCATPSRRTRW